MGFSTSGAVLIILVGFLMAVSVIVPTVFSVSSTTGDAFATQNDQLRDQQNTALTIDSFHHIDESDSDTDAIVIITNDGSNSLSVSETTAVVNGHYYPVGPYTEATTIIDGDTEREDSNVWAPGTQLEIELSESDSEVTIDGDSDSIRITTERGVADRATISDSETDGESGGED
ncbi:fla cluster protein FlaF [Natrialba magadii ATCC 43099]|uniref:Fla cluster protein FlaF n=1 Tax=Natrialba magadii (strain ATCC 43099 / DSM 3394 / CCM 3739 / CIP 104546 / IAM 13178 / JCM 8861 / NBRC 102185 / NCIMB 2190 / MS3) TaxID=547559 RepID=D3T0E0_NATMM|nr:flagellin [Natrialba magadii]ADD06419.1 fla cluster protein FlaF [Natrialba magadii ATCC 43099]ELY31694.1 flagellin [Natrialba magadii ATCC 43099]